MNQTALILLLAVLSATWVSACTKKNDTVSVQSATQAGHEDPDGYYTCPMHPQVHEHGPGKCPICGMALVKVSGKKPEAKPDTSSSHEIHATNEQLKLAGIGKYTVEKKDLVFKIPVSGRMISAREIVFQVYESDLQVVRAGLDFLGSPSADPSQVLKGQLRQVDNLVDPASRTVRVLGTLSEIPGRVVIDGGFHGEIRGTLKGQLAIPEEAVLHAGGRDLVYLISGENQVKPQSVTLGKKTEAGYQVLAGLTEGDVISTGPNFLIDSEAKIRGGSDQAHH